jgi:hypothetical protein
MAARRSRLILILATIIPSMGASYRTQNFVVEAPTAEMAQQVGQYAEYYRKEKATLWLGQEMANWSQPCPIYVNVTRGGAGGATSFAYSQGQVMSQRMEISGAPDRLLNSVLPHEITHTVFAYHFRRPVPRWADEGGSVLSEDQPERDRHDALVRQILNTPGRAMPLRRLFQLTDYPEDVMCLYAEGFSVSNFLVEKSSRPAFLAFIACGMSEGWDAAVRRHYSYQSVDDLERAWQQSLMATKHAPTQFASNPQDGDTTGKTVVRLTAPPVQPLDTRPSMIVRGQSSGSESGPSGGWNAPPRSTYEATPTSMPGSYRSDPYPPPPPPGAVMLGMPQSYQPPPPSVQLGTPVQVPIPVQGYPR